MLSALLGSRGLDGNDQQGGWGHHRGVNLTRVAVAHRFELNEAHHGRFRQMMSNAPSRADRLRRQVRNQRRRNRDLREPWDHRLPRGARGVARKLWASLDRGDERGIVVMNEGRCRLVGCAEARRAFMTVGPLRCALLPAVQPPRAAQSLASQRREVGPLRRDLRGEFANHAPPVELRVLGIPREGHGKRIRQRLPPPVRPSPGQQRALEDARALLAQVEELRRPACGAGAPRPEGHAGAGHPRLPGGAPLASAQHLDLGAGAAHRQDLELVVPDGRPMERVLKAKVIQLEQYLRARGITARKFSTLPIARRTFVKCT